MAKLNDDIKEMMRRVYDGAKAKNCDEIKQALFDSSFPNISKDEKELMIFVETLTCLTMFQLGEDILHYLIFDYKIDEKLLDKINKKNVNVEKAEEMFLKRKQMEDFYQDLTKELDKNNSSSKRKSKI
jgi:hypothetical protein